MKALRRPADFCLWVMSNLDSAGTGVDAVIWVSVGEPTTEGNERGPRIYVVPGSSLDPRLLANAIAVTLGDPPDVMGDITDALREQVVEFVSANRAVLLDHWWGKLSTGEFIERLQALAEGAKP